MTAVTTLFFDLREVAKMLDVNYTTAWALVTTGQLRALQIGRRWKITQASIDAFIQQGTDPARSDPR